MNFSSQFGQISSQNADFRHKMPDFVTISLKFIPKIHQVGFRGYFCDV